MIFFLWFAPKSFQKGNAVKCHLCGNAASKSSGDKVKHRQLDIKSSLMNCYPKINTELLPFFLLFMSSVMMYKTWDEGAIANFN